MPKHEFGIMPQAPQAGKCFDKYEPEKYNCISVSDDDIQPCLHAFRCGKTYWHSLDRGGVEEMRKLFGSLRDNGTTILLASHAAEDIDLLCDKVYEVAEGTVTERIQN